MMWLTTTLTLVTTFSALAASSSTTVATTNPTCPGSNGAVYTSGGGLYTIKCGVDYYGGAIDNGRSVTSFKACIDTCATTDTCTDLSYIASSRMCYLKSDVTAPTRVNSRVWSAVLVSAIDVTLSCPAAGGAQVAIQSSTYTIQCSADSSGAIISKQTVASLVACGKYCNGVTGCVAAAFKANVCYAKSAIGTVKSAANIILIKKNIGTTTTTASSTTMATTAMTEITSNTDIASSTTTPSTTITTTTIASTADSTSTTTTDSPTSLITTTAMDPATTITTTTTSTTTDFPITTTTTTTAFSTTDATVTTIATTDTQTPTPSSPAQCPDSYFPINRVNHADGSYTYNQTAIYCGWAFRAVPQKYMGTYSVNSVYDCVDRCRLAVGDPIPPGQNFAFANFYGSAQGGHLAGECVVFKGFWSQQEWIDDSASITYYTENFPARNSG